MNICVIGLGSMGKRRIGLIRNVYTEAYIVGVDQRVDRCQEMENLFNIKTYDSIEKAMRKTHFDSVVVCTSPVFHHKIINFALKSNCHVFTEINLISDGYAENMRLAKAKKRVLFLSSTMLYREEIRYIKKKIMERDANVNYIYHVGQYLPTWHPWESYRDFFVSNKRTNGCRELFAIELPWLIDVFGPINNLCVEGGKMTTLDINYPDYYIVTVHHKDGTVGCLNFNVASRLAVRKLQIYGPSLYLAWEGTPDTIYFRDASDAELKNVKLCNISKSMNKSNNTIVEKAYEDELREFFESIDGERCPRYSFEKDKVVLDWIDFIEKIGYERI